MIVFKDSIGFLKVVCALQVQLGLSSLGTRFLKENGWFWGSRAVDIMGGSARALMCELAESYGGSGSRQRRQLDVGLQRPRRCSHVQPRMRGRPRHYHQQFLPIELPLCE